MFLMRKFIRVNTLCSPISFSTRKIVLSLRRSCYFCFAQKIQGVYIKEYARVEREMVFP